MTPSRKRGDGEAGSLGPTEPTRYDWPSLTPTPLHRAAGEAPEDPGGARGPGAVDGVALAATAYNLATGPLMLPL